jgi:sialate O-acetylesterase
LESSDKYKSILDKQWEADDIRRPSGLYNAMIAPMHTFPIKGAIWYQGESNAGNFDRVNQYRSLLPDLVTSWRKEWGIGDFPFIWVQLAPWMKRSERPEDTSWARMREVMENLQKTIPNGAMACIIDGGSQNDVHPPYKESVGERLALQARRIAYNQDVLASGPTLKAMSVKDNTATLKFDNVGDGLTKKALSLDLGNITVSGDTLVGFTICGTDKKFVNAQARITDKNTVEVWADDVVEPEAVRYAWANFPVANLYNSADLPAGPFRTDDFTPPPGR